MGNGSIFDAHFEYIYFIYGLAFFSMGLALLVESRRSSQFRLARAGHSLGLFGILHSTHEFLEMFVIISGNSLSVTGEVLRVTLLVASFLPLLVFGVQMMPRSEKVSGFPSRMLILASVAFIMQVVIIRFTYHPAMNDWLMAVDVLSRYTLAMPGAALAGLALMRQRDILREEGMEPFGRDLAWAALAMVWYGIIGQAFPHRSLVFPSMYINADTFRIWFGFPVQLLRAGTALVTAAAMIRALRAFDEEMQRRLEAAKRTEQDLQNAARELSLLYEASSLLSSTYDLDVVLQESIKRIVEVIEPIRGGFIMVSANGSIVADYYAAYGLPVEVVEQYKAGQMCHCVGERQAHAELCWEDKNRINVTAKINTSSQRPFYSEHDIQKIVLPLQSGIHEVGKIVLETAPEGPYIASSDAPTILALTRQLAIAIDNAVLVLELRQREARRSELLQHTTDAQEAERQRIARELHDETGQALTALALGLKGTLKLLESSPDKAAAQIAHLKNITTQSLDELRHLISNLRPSHLDDLGLVAAIRWYVDEIQQRSDLRVQFTVAGEAYRLPPEMETTLFRITQEGLNNTVKHAQASHAILRLEYLPGQVRLYIQDNGVGFASEEVMKPGAGLAWGLIGIQERAMLAQGNFDVQSAPGDGTVLKICIPISHYDDNDCQAEEEHTDE